MPTTRRTILFYGTDVYAICCTMQQSELEKMVDGLSMDAQSVGSCNSCQKGKAVQQSFKTSTQPPAKRLLDIIYMDIIVINIESNKGEIAVLVCTDNHSGCKFCFPLKLHSGKEILKIILKWMLWAEHVTNRKAEMHTE